MNYPLCRVYPISSSTNLLEMVSGIEDPTVTIQCRIIFEYPIFSRIFRLFPSVQLMRGPCWRLQNCRDTLQNLISGNKIHQESSRYPKLDHHSHFVDHAMVCCHSMTGWHLWYPTFSCRRGASWPWKGQKESPILTIAVLAIYGISIHEKTFRKCPKSIQKIVLCQNCIKLQYQH